ncbi:MAG: leucine-rich repeat domain-containing protein [Lachnospiraceae bacterium]|nr:leucine-rich repeat domain-containing protein [Lachnospiraceae bacterium]
MKAKRSKGYILKGIVLCCVCVMFTGCSFGKRKVETENTVKAKFSENYREIVAKGLIFKVSKKKKTAAVTSYYKLDQEVFEIPDSILYKKQVYPVTKVEDGAFGSDASVKEVSLGKNVEEIGNDAFYSCSELKKINFSEGLKRIGSYALGACAFTEIEFPASLETLGDYACTASDALKKVTISGSLKNWGMETFSECHALEEVTFTEGAATVGKGAFTNDDALKKVSFPDSFKDIGDEAFWGCEALTEITLPEGLIKIGENAFMNSGIRELRIPGGVTEIGLAQVDGMSELKKLIVPEAYASDLEEIFGEDVEIETY